MRQTAGEERRAHARARSAVVPKLLAALRTPRSPAPALVAALALMLVAAAPAAARAPGNDPEFWRQWADSNTGQPVPLQEVPSERLGEWSPGLPGADERATSAWNYLTSSGEIVVGELDTGVEYAHPDLASNIWTNAGGLGGCEAGTHGFNVLEETKKCEPLDEDTGYGGHGTHVAGIIGAAGNGGVVGVDWRTTILPVKWLSSAGEVQPDLEAALALLVKLKKEEGVNVRVVNDSPTFPGESFSAGIKQQIEALGKLGVLFVTAAGNTGVEQRYPCDYHLSNEICVTATNNRDELPNWANWSSELVDLAAPGVSIYSTLRSGRYGYLSGGSMAAAQVSGAAALVLAHEPWLSAAELKSRITSNVRRVPSLENKVNAHGVLDICKALSNCAEAPSVVAKPPSEVKTTTATLNATVNPNRSNVSQCFFEYGPAGKGLESKANCAGNPGSGVEPVNVSASLSGLQPGQSYRYRIFAKNAIGEARSEREEEFKAGAAVPSVHTGQPREPVGSASATLTGSVNPNGASVTECSFEYASTPEYGHSAPCSPAPGGGTSPVAVSAAIEGLQPGKTYHYRLVAKNTEGSASPGEDVAFTTEAAPPVVSTGSAESVTQSGATLNGLVNPNGAFVTVCQLEYGTSTSYGASAPCRPALGESIEPAAVQGILTGLAPGTTYHFRLVAANQKGAAKPGSDESFATPQAPPPPPPPAPEAPAPPPGQGTLPFVAVAPLASAALVRTYLKVDSMGAFKLEISCGSTALYCAGTVTLRTPVRAHGRRTLLVLASGPFSLLGGRTGAMKLQLSRSARTLIGRLHLLNANSTIVVAGASGTTKTTQKLLLKLERR